MCSFYVSVDLPQVFNVGVGAWRTQLIRCASRVTRITLPEAYVIYHPRRTMTLRHRLEYVAIGLLLLAHWGSILWSACWMFTD